MKTEDIKLFHFIVDSGSLTKASERLDLPKSNLSRRIKNLEAELNIDLFHRNQRSMALSENGRQFYTRTKPVLIELESAIEELLNDSVALSGHLRLQFLPLPNTIDLEKIVFKFMALHPNVNIEIIISSDERNLIEHNIDLAFRIGERLEDSTLIARPLKTVTLGYYATPEYLQQYGYPESEQDLEQHDFIISRLPSGKLANQMPLSNGRFFKAKGKLIVNNMNIMLHACLTHQGMAHLANFHMREEVEQGRLVHLFPNIDSHVITGWLVYPTRATLSMAAKALIDFVIKELGPHVID